MADVSSFTLCQFTFRLAVSDSQKAAGADDCLVFGLACLAS
jgi:hypothetical protein